MELQRLFPLKAGNASSGGGGGGGGGGSFAVTCSPKSVNKYSAVPGATVTCSTVTATPASPGVAPFVYSWSIDNANISIQTPAVAATTFRCTGSGSASDDVGTATCIVTDVNGLVGYVSIQVEFQIGGSRL